VLATQRPSTNVITGLIKANIPSRIAFMVVSNTDSRIIIDMPGAEKLLGKGDMLFMSSWEAYPSRIQGAFLSEDEVEKVVGYVKSVGEPDYLDESLFEDEEEDEDGDYSGGDYEDDPLMPQALKVIQEQDSASASMLQRRLKIGYNRAARIIETMEEMGIVGPAQGSKPREVLKYTE
jgi:S-DNA-T family DNA segregation ATPase FtsK/SpoIIIE